MQGSVKTWLEIAKEIIPEIEEHQVSYILWEETCYPFDDVTALVQFKERLEHYKKTMFSASEYKNINPFSSASFHAQ